MKIDTQIFPSISKPKTNPKTMEFFISGYKLVISYISDKHPSPT